ncbi:MULTISPECIES: CvpA family protein [Bacillaceae]|nr:MULTISPECIES: CvpA family protein [Bacillaceae]MDU1844223.1 CvpA family protein [Niallia nealsonii]
MFMLDIILVILLLFGLLRGLKRGFIMQVIHLTGFIVAFIVANKYYIPLSQKLTLWIPYPNAGESSFLHSLIQTANIEEVFYRGFSFIVIFFVVKIIWQILGSMIDFVASIPILKQLNTWAGAVLGFVETYLLLFLLLYISILIPVGFMQTQLNESSVAAWMIENTPYFSEKIKDLWFDYMAS